MWQVELIYKSFDCRILFAVGRALSIGLSTIFDKLLTGTCNAVNLVFRPQNRTEEPNANATAKSQQPTTLELLQPMGQRADSILWQKNFS